MKESDVQTFYFSPRFPLSLSRLLARQSVLRDPPPLCKIIARQLHFYRMALSYDNDFVILSCANPNPIEYKETFVSTADIHGWDLQTILRYQTLKIKALRSRLIEQSSYFRGLLSGSFSESNLETVSVQWNLETFLNVLNFLYGRTLHVTSKNFLLLFEAALYFGIEALLLKCKSWFSEVSSSTGPGLPEIQLDDLIHIWNFGIQHANDFVPELCASYLARNFMWAMSNNFFRDVPYDLLLDCTKHPYLTIYSERNLCEALLFWLDSSSKEFEPVSKFRDDHADILKQIHTSLLPLWFAAGKRKSCNFSELADKSTETILKLIKILPVGSIDALGDVDLEHLRIRLTEYAKKVDLSGCPQITSVILLLSMFPPSHCVDLDLWKTSKLSLINLEDFSCDHSRISQILQPVLSFEAVERVDISKCRMLHLDATIELFSKSFPSLRRLKAAYLLNFNIATLRKLVQRCPLLSEVDMTVDITPLIPAEVSVVSCGTAIMAPVSKKSFSVGNNSLDVTFYHSGTLLSNITRLVLEGRSDICDSDLQYLTALCHSLEYLNLKGCITITDVGISNLISSCVKLHSIIVCDTSFGMNSIQALCSSMTCSGSPEPHAEKRCLHTLACNLQILHVGGCKFANERFLMELISQAQTLKSLVLRDTHLIDDALYSFSGISLEMLDVSNTMISRAALAHIVHGNPALKFLNVRGCRNLIQLESKPNGADPSSSYFHRDLCTLLGKKCKLEEIALGWGFSQCSLETLKPAFVSLRAITIGLGGSFSEDLLGLLPNTCPLLESMVLYFQLISDSIVKNIIASLRHLQALALCYCLGDISISSLCLSMPNLRKLRLERVTPWMTNDDLVILTQSAENLVELSLLGCRLLNPDSLDIISKGWPGLISIHLEECGEMTANGASSIFNCSALEDLLLRHNGIGIHGSFILDAASKLPMLRRVSLDLCDASEGDFDIPSYSDRGFLSIVKIARCKIQMSSSKTEFSESRRRLVHKGTFVLVWNSKELVRTVVKERL